MKSRKHNQYATPNLSKARHAIRAAIVASAFLVCGLAASSSAQAQATGGTIFGWGPAGEKVTVHGSTGVRRHTTVKSSGRYTLGSLPLGVYSVTLEKEGTTVDERKNIRLTVGGGAEVDFACPNDQCAASPSR